MSARIHPQPDEPFCPYCHADDDETTCTTEHNEWCVDRAVDGRTVEYLRAQLQRAVEGLRRYGHHERDCDMFTSRFNTRIADLHLRGNFTLEAATEQATRPCTCGLDDLLAALTDG